MSVRPTRVSLRARSFRATVRTRSTASQLIASIGLIGSLFASGALHAQADASAALIEQGNYWQNMGRADLAEESWRKLLRVDPQSADALYGMAQIELGRGNAEPARTWINRLRAAHPNDPRAVRLQQQAQQGGVPTSDLQRARAAAQAGRAAEALQLYRSVIGNNPPPDNLALEYYQLLGGTPTGWDEGRKGLEQLAKDKPDNLNVRLALAQLQTYREPTRRDGIRSLSALSKQAGVGTAARASWRQALIWLDARAPDAPLYQEFLSTAPDAAVSARLESLTETKTAATPASPSAQPLSEGFKALDRGDQTTAEARFQQALRLLPGDSEALGGLGLIRLRQERFAQAQEYLEQASRTGGRKWNQALQSATYWNLIGQATAARQRNDLGGAQSLLERAVRIDAKEPVGQTALADVRLANGELPQAEQGYTRVLEAKPGDPQAIRGLINVYTQQGRANEALALAQRLTPEQAAQIGGLQNVRVDQARAQARQQNEAGDPAGAQRTLEDAMLTAPDSPWIRLDLANIYRRQGLTAQARGVMDGLLMSQPDMPDALYASALLASDAGDPISGLQYLERIPPNTRTRDMTQLQRKLFVQGQAQQAQALARSGQAGAARGLLAQAESSLGNDIPAELWGQLASAYAEIGDAPRALAMSRQLLARSPNPPIGDRLLYASILVKTNQDIELAALLRNLQATNMTPAQRADFDNLRVSYSLRQTDALREAGNLEAAYNAMAPLLAERPNDTQVMAALARLYSAARDDQQALALYQRILQRTPTDLDTLLAASSSATAIKDYGNAENYVMAALKQAPEQSRVLAAAGRMYRAAGDNGRAEQYLRAAVAADNRAAGGLGTAGARGTGGGMPSGNPFAGMTGGAQTSASPFGLSQTSASSQAAMPGVPVSPFAGMRGNNPAAAQAAVPVSMQMPAATAAAPASTAGMPWASGASSAPAATSNTAAGKRSATTASRTTQRNIAAGNMRANATAAAPTANAAGNWQPPPATMQQPSQAPIYGGYPVQTAEALPVPSQYPRPGSSLANDPGWTTPPLSNLGAPANPLLSELQELQAERSTVVTAGTVYRNRAGEGGLSKLSDLQIPIQARIPVGSGKLVVSATPTVLDAGSMASDYATTSRFGGGPQAALNQSLGSVRAPESQSASGIGLSVGYEGKNLNASIGTTPLGFQETNVIGNVGYTGALTDSLSLKADLSRKPVTDSLLSFAGTEDRRTGDKWGGIVATGGRLDLTHDDGTYGIYGYGSYSSITGLNVADNTRAEGGGGLYMHILRNAGSSLTAGLNIGLMGYDKNLSYFTYGHGGYFSPQRYVSVAFPIDWQGRSNRLAWRVNASLGLQSFKQDDASYFPTDAARQANAVAANTSATSLGLTSGTFTGVYTGTTHTGFAYNFAGVLEYQLAPQLYLGGSVGLNNAQNYRQVTGGLYLRYMFGVPGNSFSAPGAGTGGTLAPVTSPYTPLL
ncbi:cellulose biosynthesis protein BcsC [Variovorax ginsengisoli]|uniref:Tetratricopeptide (TPR) repeat protein n=1 Tax=Variovorax ginsengisoli TaxID=363844 RepID=A0ABT9S8D5_9BURK|nr:cellulose biosynthesis protein BcsC [Variovorax ginsengisoli]MDP9900455.1 tetratricopeptide (TPR) repeat protein [Variovorax ginsengisoli]